VLHSEVSDSHMDLEAEVPQSIAKRLKLSSYVAAGTSGTHSAYHGVREVN